MKTLEKLLKLRFGSILSKKIKNGSAVIQKKKNIHFFEVKALNDKTAQQRNRVRAIIKNYRLDKQNALQSGLDINRVCFLWDRDTYKERIRIEYQLYRKLERERRDLTALYLKQIKSLHYESFLICEANDG